MKVLLINPPLTIYKGGSNPRVFMPIGLLYIAAQLEKAGHLVKIFDAVLKAEIKKIPSKPNWHFGESWDSIADTIRQASPEVVGITSMFSSQSLNVKKAAALVKKISPHIVTVVGGAHPSSRPSEMLKDPNMDAVVVGEGEYVISSFLDALKGPKEMAAIPGLFTKLGGKLIENNTPEPIVNLDALALPAYHLYDMERYFFLQRHRFRARPLGFGKREVSLITSRGCPFNCVFCAIHPVMGKKWRPHSAEYVLNHIAFLKKNYRVDFIHFEDDNLSLDPQRLLSILDGLCKDKLRLRWEPANGLMAKTLDEPLIKKALESGCSNLAIAIESGVQRVLDEIIDKGLNLSDVIKTAQICKKLKVHLCAYYLIGLPGETLEDIKATLNFAKKMLLQYYITPHISFASPMWGSRLNQICKEKGYFAQEPTPESLALAYDAHGKSLIKTPDFSPEDLRRLLAGAHRMLSLLMFFNALRNPRRLFTYLKIIWRNQYVIHRMLFNV